MEETKKVTLLGSLIDFAKSFGGYSEGSERNILLASREKILKEYGDKRLLVEVMPEKEFDKILNAKNPTDIRTRIKTSGGSNGGKGKNVPTQQPQLTTESREEGEYVK